MKDDLDRVLEGLGRVEAPSGLEGRVLRALDAPVRRRNFVWAWAAAVALILVGVLVGSLSGAKSPKSPKTAGFAYSPAIAIQPQKTGHATVPAANIEAAAVVGKRLEPQRPTDNAPLRVAVVMGRPTSESSALAEAGFPAPEEPLSEQEKLLLKLARRATPTTMALFNTKLREEHAAVAKAEFDEFFKPAVVATEPDPDLHVANPEGTEEKKDEALAGKQ